MKYVRCLIIVFSVLLAASVLAKAMHAGASVAASAAGISYELSEARDWETDDGEDETEYC